MMIVLMLVGCGSYFYAEQYTVHCSQRDFVRKVDSLKYVHPEFRWTNSKPNGTFEDSDGISTPFESIGNKEILEYNFVFYIPSENKLFLCHIVSYDSLNSNDEFTLLFASVADTNYSENYYLNTKISTKEEDAKYKHLFEELILDKINVYWEN